MSLHGFGWGSRMVALLACSMLVMPPSSLWAQATPPSEPTAETANTAGEDAAPLAVADELDAEPAFTTEQLEELVGPIALYPDPLLVQVLLASTYPLDVVRAHRFLQGQPDVDPEALVDQAEQQGWDPSVISLVAFPTVLERMATDLDWTEALGDAMALQSEDLLDAVQNLRELAQANGALESNEYQTVSFGEEETIAIEPAEPEVIYVPQYEPQQVYVTQPASTTYVTQPAPTTVVQQSGYSEGTLLATGLIAFTTGILLGSYFGRKKDRYDYYWGPKYKHVHWHNHRVYPPYYRPGGGYRPPHYRPRPPGYRPGGAWRPRPELYRDARVRVDNRRKVTRNVNRNVNINVNDRKRPATGNRASTLDRQLKDRGRDRPGATRPGAPQRPATRDKAKPGTADRTRPATRPGGNNTAFGNRAQTTDVRRNRDRGEASVDRAKRPVATPGQRPQAGQQRLQAGQRPQANQRPQTGQRPQAGQRPKPGQRPQAGQRPKSSGSAFENRNGGSAGKASKRGKASASGRERKR